MKEKIKKTLEIKRDIKKEELEILEILKGKELDSVKMDSIRAILVELAKEITDAKTKAVFDEVTGCVTQKFIREFLGKEMERTKRYKEKLSITMVDIDYLKQINDTFGHVVGTHVIESVAKIIKTNVRKADVVSRYGGDEFLVVCPNTGIKECRSLAKRIEKAADGYEFQTDLNVSVCTGTAEYRESLIKSDDFINEADKELYQMKKKRELSKLLG